MFFDAHSDIWSDVTDRRLRGETDILRRYHLPRLRQGGCEGGIFAFWTYAPYKQRTLDMMACTDAETAACGDIAIVHSYEEMQAARKAGKFYIFKGVEGMAAIDGDPAGIDWYYDYGCRHGMLTWNESNALAAGAMSGVDTGLTAAGKAAVRRMQALGMLVDVSHLNVAGFYDIMDLTTGPIMASHSNARALCDVPRNLNDDQLRAIRDCGGVVGLNAYRKFVHTEDQHQTVRQLARHAAYIADRIGIEHVCCGFDFCEFLPDEQGNVPTDRQNPYGLEDCSKAPAFFQCLTDLGMTDRELQMIATDNCHRVIQRVLHHSNKKS